VVDPISQSGATLFRHIHDDDDDALSYIVACRGSANLKNFGTNLKFGLVPATKLSFGKSKEEEVILPPEDALVHEGFQDASVGLWEELGPELINVLNNDDNDKTKDIVFTGHSLGGATALLCSIHYINTLSSSQIKSSLKKPSPSIISFGGPKLCNKPFAQHLRHTTLKDCKVYHIVHDKDPILANNQQLWNTLGYENVGVEMECDSMNPTILCTEKESSSDNDSVFAWNILDHCYYMGVFVGPRLFV